MITGGKNWSHECPHDDFPEETEEHIQKCRSKLEQLDAGSMTPELDQNSNYFDDSMVEAHYHTSVTTTNIPSKLSKSDSTP